MKKVLISFIHLYQKMPFSSHQKCRFTPTCSQYAIEAIQEWGCIKGIFLSFRRILRCNPWGSYGFNPVPKRSLKNEKN